MSNNNKREIEGKKAETNNKTVTHQAVTRDKSREVKLGAQLVSESKLGQKKEGRRKSESKCERQEAHSEMNLHFQPRLICQREYLRRLSFSEHGSMHGIEDYVWGIEEEGEKYRSWDVEDAHRLLTDIPANFKISVSAHEPSVSLHNPNERGGNDTDRWQQ